MKLITGGCDGRSDVSRRLERSERININLLLPPAPIPYNRFSLISDLMYFVFNIVLGYILNNSNP